MPTYKGSCFCGAVQFTVRGEPAAAGYCHCESCRHWSAGPVNAFTLWKPEALRVTRGADQIGTYHKTPRSYRKWCKSLRRTPVHRASCMATHRRVCSGHPGFSVQRRCPRQLSGNETAHQGRPAEDERPAKGDGRLRRQRGGIESSGASARTLLAGKHVGVGRRRLREQRACIVAARRDLEVFCARPLHCGVHQLPRRARAAQGCVDPGVMNGHSAAGDRVGQLPHLPAVAFHDERAAMVLAFVRDRRGFHRASGFQDPRWARCPRGSRSRSLRWPASRGARRWPRRTART